MRIEMINLWMSILGNQKNKKKQKKYATFFYTAYINFIFYIKMEEINKAIKYDLRQTRFSQNYQPSIQFHDSQQFNNYPDNQRNNKNCHEPSYIKNAYNKIFLIQDDQMGNYDQEKGEGSSNILEELNEYKQQSNNMFGNFTKSLSYLDQSVAKNDYYIPIKKIDSYKIAKQQQKKQQQQESNQSQQSDDVFSQKISIIRQLQKKLQSLHQRIKIPTNGINYLNDYKVNIQKEYQNYTESQINQQISQTQDTNKQYEESVLNKEEESVYNRNEQSVISKKSQSNKQMSKIRFNYSIQSQSMLLSKDQSVYEKQLEIPTKKIIPHAFILNQQSNNHINQQQVNPQIQFIQTIRIVQVPYLIEVNRQNQEKIQSKKSFYFQQNDDIHQTFQQFTHKQSIHQNSQIDNTSHQQRSIFQKSQVNINKSKYNDQIQQNSLTSVNQSNKTYHNVLRQKINDISFHYEENSQILSKLQTKNNNTQVQQLQQKVKVLSIQNSQLKDKIKQFTNQRNDLLEQNCILEQELNRVYQQQNIYKLKLQSYQQKLQNIQQQFLQIMSYQKNKLKQTYQKQIQQYQQEQTQYANRIISFEEQLEEYKDKENKFNTFIQEQNQHLHQLIKINTQKEFQIQIQINKRLQTQEFVIQRQNQLKTIIQNLQKDNHQLKNIIKQIHIRYQSDGFYILQEEADQLRKTIEGKDLIHIQELQTLQNRYTTLIQKYQTQLQSMKRSLQKVRHNKSISIQSKSNNQSSNYSTLNNYTNHNVYNNQRGSINRINYKKRQSIGSPKNSHKMLSSLLGQSQMQIKQFSQLKMRHVQSVEHQDIQSVIHQRDISVSKIQRSKCSIQMDEQTKSQTSSLKLTPSILSESNMNEQLLRLQMQTLRQQNIKLHSTLSLQRKQKQSLSQKLLQINTIMAKYISQANQFQQEEQKNEQVFMKCVQQLQKQYQLNKKLKQKIIKLQKCQSIINDSSNSNTSNYNTVSYDQIKVHPIYIQLSKKYTKSKKYIKVLEKQLKDLTLLPDFNSQTKKKCCLSKKNTIDELKSIIRDQINQSES